MANSVEYKDEPAYSALFGNEGWLKDLFEGLNDLIHIVGYDGTILYVNPAWTSTLQYQLEEIQAHSLYEFIYPEDQASYMAYREKVIREEPHKEGIVFRMRTKSGEMISVEGTISVRKDANGKPLYTRGIFRDVTARLKAEASVKEREQNLQQLLVNAPDSVIVIDRENKVTFWNPMSEKLFGWTADEVVGQPLSGFIIPPQHRRAHDEGMKRYLATDVPHVLNTTVNLTALNKEGKEFYISLTVSKTIQKGDVAFVAFIRDITEQRQAEIELERKSKELERSNTNLEEFAHAASHDLKEPIRKVQTFASRLKETLAGKMNDTEKNYFNRLETAAQRMGLLVDDLLEYSHVSQGEEHMEEIDLNKKLRIVQEDLEVAIEEKKAQIIIEPLPVVRGHRRQLQQLFQNLLSNALKYTRPGVIPQISVTATEVKGSDTGLSLPADCKEKAYHCIAVADNGIGFEQSNADRIFKMFQRLHGKAEYSGTGVGLSIVRKVVENHNGYITADGIPGEGATFRVYLPV
ncbi:MAG: domain S-box-containing protein [Flaviaesturariibacter sp.]|nr:domain S-box-containing protein [Flaviaesturariibacter sp.]